MNKVYCYNRWAFETLCKSNGWDEEHIPENAAFISICGTPDCQEQIIQEREYHYFDIEHPQILNLDFDDITRAQEPIPGHEGLFCFGIGEWQAYDAVQFIKNNLGKDFYIHCRAGKSRSQAFVRYILDMYDGLYDFIIRPENPPINYNQYVLSELKNEARQSYEELRVGFLREDLHIKVVCADRFGVIIEVDELGEDNRCSLEGDSSQWRIRNFINPVYVDELELISTVAKIVESEKP